MGNDSEDSLSAQDESGNIPIGRPYDSGSSIPSQTDLGNLLEARKRPPEDSQNEGAQTVITTADVEQEFKASISELAMELGKRRGPKAFSRNAVNELAIQQANFLEDMGVEAINTARRNQADVVSATDVRNAEAALRSRGPSFPGRLLEPVGGLFAGAGLAQLYAVLSAPRPPPPSTLAYLIAAISTIIGIALLSFGLAHK